jgi:hypothetical protein
MTCRAWEDLLQQHLDGQEPSLLWQHLRDCPHCAAHKADTSRLLAAVELLTPAAPPPHLADRLTSALLAEARGRKSARWRKRAAVLGGLAAAASLLLAFGLWWRSADRKRSPDDSPLVERREPPPPLRDNVARAGDAVASLTNKTAKDSTKEPAALLSAVKDTAEPLTRVPAPVEPKLDKPMREAADGVSNGLSPVTDSARRAVGLFFRDLPVGKSDRPAEASQ